jgi:hypothetical protein
LISDITDAPGNPSWSGGSARSLAFRGTTSTINGYSNTQTLAGFGAAAHPAASYCWNLTSGGYLDWYLPANTELNALYQNRSLIGNFGAAGYWSSTEVSTQNASYLLIDTRFSGTWGTSFNKTYGSNRVRCVRRAN